jgi:Ser/Thr protein kinase RdoA (MazF antagonist)
MNDNTIIDFAKLYTDIVDDFEMKSGGSNNIYIIKGNKNFALRITPVSHRNFEEIKSEIAFMLYLHSNRVPLTKPIQGIDGEYCYERQTENKNWIISAFEIAIGEDYRTRVYPPERIFIVGKTLGKIHRLSKKYVPVGVQPRRQWHQNYYMSNANKVFKNYDEKLFNIFKDYINQLANLPKDNDSFGLIHGDYVLMNYFFDKNNITVFDFDDCQYSWFINDIATWMVRFMIGAEPTKLNSRTKEAAEYFSDFMQGYLTENTISMEQVENIDLFFKMTEYSMLVYILERKSDGLNKWGSEVVEGILERILNGKVFIDVDFVSIYKSIV